MNRKLGLAVVSTAWLAVCGCESEPGPVAQGMPRNESTSQRDTMDPIGLESTQRQRDLGSEVGSRVGQRPSEAYSAPEPTPEPAPQQ